MAIVIRCECGKEIRAKEEYGGKRAVCPACRREFVVPLQGAPEQATPVVEPGPPPLPPVGVEQYEPVQEVSPEGARPWWKDPIVVIGATVPSLVLLVFFGYLAWQHGGALSNKEFSPSQATDLAARAPAHPGAVPKEESAPWQGALPQSTTASATPGVITDSIGMKLVLIPAGEFQMGSPLDDSDAEEFEMPQHYVRITHPFYLGAYEVTRGQFRSFVDETGYRTGAERDGKGSNGWNEQMSEFQLLPRYTWRDVGFNQTDDHPVVNVSWNDAVAFASWLSKKEGKRYRLPTDAEWEYACRAGTTTKYSCGDDPERLAVVGNVSDASYEAYFNALPGRHGKGKDIISSRVLTIASRDGFVFTAPIGRFQPNKFGLFDMHGNVFEYCSDWFGAEYYAKLPSIDPQGPVTGVARTSRGGSWYLGYHFARSANFTSEAPNLRHTYVGFRLVRDVVVQSEGVVEKKNAGEPTDLQYLTHEEIVTAMLPQLESQQKEVLTWTFTKEKSNTDVNVEYITARACPPDPRRVPWLWEMEATVSWMQKGGNDDPAHARKKKFLIYRALIHCVPRASPSDPVRGSVTILWMEGKESKTGPAVRTHPGPSEWRKECRLELAANWLAAVKKLESYTSEGKLLTEKEKDAYWVSTISRLTKLHEITETELKEIMSQFYGEADAKKTGANREQRGGSVK